MNLDRGSQRAVMVLSCLIALLCVVRFGIELRQQHAYQVYKRAHAAREQSFQAWLHEHPISDPQVVRYSTGKLKAEDLEEIRKGRIPGQRSPGSYERWRATMNFELARDELERDLRWEHARDHGLLDVLMPPETRRVWWNWPLTYMALIYAGLAVVAFALPWAIFLPCRWIVRGFLN